MKKFILNIAIIAVACISFCYSQDTTQAFCSTGNLGCTGTYPYRTTNGRCNNVVNQLFGAAFTKYPRIITPARYSDGISQPAKSVTGADLPSARLLSFTLFGNVSNPDSKLTVTAMQMAQFVTHDLAHSVAAATSDPCCQAHIYSVPPNYTRCMSIPIPPNDPFQKGNCMNFPRDLYDTDVGCAGYVGDGYVNQLTRCTAFLDLSTVYGSNDDNLGQVRAFQDGKMLVESRLGTSWPPQAVPNTGCDVQSTTETCYVGGDKRINATPLLSIFTILFIREHNRIAAALKVMNPTWVDETLFQEARRINIAQYQYIVYYEFLPLLLGKNNMKNAGLYVQDTGSAYVNDYNSTVNPGTINEFTAGSFRFFHTMIKGSIDLYSEQRALTGSFRLSSVQNRPMYIEQNDNFQAFTRAMTTEPTEARDFNWDPEMQTYFLRQGKNIGRDIKAFDIQRDRDHGLGSYNNMRVAAGLPRANTFDDLVDVMSATTITKLRNLYANVDDIDLTVGGDLENPVDNSVVHGPTHHYVLMKQFKNTRIGDRFWFESTAGPYPFTPAQLAEIRKASMSRIICDNSNGIQMMQPGAFVIPNSGNNAYVTCGVIPSIDLSAWQA